MTKSFTLTLLLALTATAPAVAQSAPDAPDQVVVRTADLDLASPAGQRLLDRRLSAAVIEACGTASDVDLAGSNAIRLCRVETRARLAADRERVLALAARSQSIVLAAR